MYVKTAFAVLALSISGIAHAGVDYYSGTSNPYQATRGTSPVTWNPLKSTDTLAASAGMISDDSSSPALFWESLTTASVAMAVTDNINGRLDTLASGSTFSYNGTAFSSGVDVRTALWNSGQDVANGYPTNNHIGWAVLNGGALYAIGWARISYVPDPPNYDTTDQFNILDWAYNLAGNGGDGSIVVGDSSTSGDVPEPASVAVLGLIALGAGLSRRRRA